MKIQAIYPSILMILSLIGGISMEQAICHAQSPWTEIAGMSVAKNGHSACFLDGKLYVMGGIDHYDPDGKIALPDLEVYDPVLDSWTEKKDMLVGRFNFSCCAYDGKILAVGGSEDIYSTPVSAIDAYDPLSDEWITITHIPKAGVWQTAVLLNDKIYVFGGAATELDAPYATVQIYDLLADTWSEGAEMLTPRIGHAAAASNGMIYVLGGQNTSAGYVGMKTLEVFNPETNKWTEKTGMIVPRKNPQSCELNGKIYVFGGMSGNEGFLEGGEFYDPLTESWKELSDAPRVLGVCAGSPLNGKVYIGGGHNDDIRYKSWYIYDPHYDLQPLVGRTTLNKYSIVAGTDSVQIVSTIIDPDGISLVAILRDPNGIPVDSIELFNDGNHEDGAAEDSLFANYWKVESSEEMQYYMDLKVTKTSADTVVNYFNTAVITTEELVTSDFATKDSTCSSFIGKCIWTSLTLQNNSTQYAAKNIKAKLESLDSSVWVFNPNQLYDSIPSGSYSTPESIQLMISADFSGTSVPIVVHLHSYDSIFRSDTITIDLTTNVYDRETPMVKIYPNPTNDLLSIETGKPGRYFIQITSLNGKVLYSGSMEGPRHQIDLSSFQKGIYLISVRSKDFIETRKLIKMQ